MYTLAGLYVKQGRYAKAERLHLEALETRRRVLGDDEHPLTLRSIYNMACLAATQGERKRALNLLREAVEGGWAEGWILTDPDLGSLHGGREFEAIVTEVKKRIGE